MKNNARCMIFVVLNYKLKNCNKSPSTVLLIDFFFLGLSLFLTQLYNGLKNGTLLQKKFLEYKIYCTHYDLIKLSVQQFVDY